MTGTVDKDGRKHGGGDAGRLIQNQQIFGIEARQWVQQKRCGMTRETDNKDGSTYVG